MFSQTQTIDPDEQDNSSEESFSESKRPWKDRFILGGNLGAQFGQSTYIEVSPIIGYHITEKLTAGVGFTYQYFKENYNVPTFYDYSASVIGPRAYLQHDIIYNFFAHTEYEHVWYTVEFEDPIIAPYELDAAAWFAGLGYNYMIGDRGRFQIMILYDLLHNINSIYYNPWVIRMGFNFDL